MSPPFFFKALSPCRHYIALCCKKGNVDIYYIRASRIVAGEERAIVGV